MSILANDPTRMGSPVVPGTGGDVRLSLSEIEALCFKSARGAGMEWGMAEEAGFAVRWLAARGLPGPQVLLAYLESAIRSPTGSADWGAGNACPLRNGTWLSDRAGPDRSGLSWPLDLGPIAYPLLAVPFIADASRTALRVTWAGVVIDTGPAMTHRSGDDADVETELTAQINMVESALPSAGSGRIALGYRMEVEIWQRLDAIALRTTVPTTASSRRGAGSGDATDND